MTVKELKDLLWRCSSDSDPVYCAFALDDNVYNIEHVKMVTDLDARKSEIALIIRGDVNNG